MKTEEEGVSFDPRAMNEADWGEEERDDLAESASKGGARALVNSLGILRSRVFLH